MDAFTMDDLKKAFAALPSFSGCRKESLDLMFFARNEPLTRKRLAVGGRTMEPLTFLREIFHSDASAQLLGLSKTEWIFHAALYKVALDELFDSRPFWYSEDWALAVLNFLAEKGARRT